MGYADKLRAEVANTDAEIIENEILPRKDEILMAIEKGIKRIGYVVIDSLCNTSTMEGNMVRIKDNKKFSALAKFLTEEGFKVSKCWWGYCSDGNPDMLKIRL